MEVSFDLLSRIDTGNHVKPPRSMVVSSGVLFKVGVTRALQNVSGHHLNFF